jgi:ketosteroid isomerase-like protein
MLDNRTINLVNSWFTNLNQTNLNGVLNLFASTSKIKNAAQPIIEGSKAAKTLIEGFFARTHDRFLYPMEIAQIGDVIFAHWKGYLTIEKGIEIAGIKLEMPLTVPIRGVERFVIDQDFKIKELDIVHETTTSVLYAHLSLIQENFVSFDTAKNSIEQYFSLEEIGDVEGVVALCHPNIVVVNAANPAQHGLEGARSYVQTFKDRTISRAFKIKEIAVEKDNALVSWKAKIEFKKGISFGNIISGSNFSVDLFGICRFKMTVDGKFLEIDVFHETTTAMLAAQKTIF